MKRKLTVDNSIIVKTKLDKSTSELDFDMYNDVLGEDKVGIAFDEDGVNTFYEGYSPETMPVKIEVLKKFIKKAEKAGCNYISIDFNGDHPDYTFYGIDVHAATQNEIDEIENKDKKEKLEKAEKLRKEAERLSKEAKKLEE